MFLNAKSKELIDSQGFANSGVAPVALR